MDLKYLMDALSKTCSKKNNYNTEITFNVSHKLCIYHSKSFLVLTLK